MLDAVSLDCADIAGTVEADSASLLAAALESAEMQVFFTYSYSHTESVYFQTQYFNTVFMHPTFNKAI